jgi:glucose-6-phosphate 1-dehydrogenase
MQITIVENAGVPGREPFYDQTGAVRDAVQNHMFQVFSKIAMESPARFDSECMHDEKVSVLQAIAPIDERNLVRHQLHGYLNESGVAQVSRIEMFAPSKLRM